MKRWPLGFLLVIAISAHAQSFWDGNAAMQRGDAAFEAGSYAMSNAFARDTEIVVEDPSTGKTATAKVVGRVDDRLDILVLLSPAAALALGLEQGEIIQVRVTIRKVVAESTPILAEDTAPSTDPDRITVTVAPPTTEEPPAVEVTQAVKETTPAETSTETESAKESVPAESVTTAVEEAAVEEAVVEEAAVEEAVVETAPVEEPVVETPAIEETAVVETAPIEEPAAEEAAVEEPVVEAPATEEDALLAELAARAPQKQLYLPPREDEMFVYQEPVEPPTVEVAEAEPETETEPVTETVTEPVTVTETEPVVAPLVAAPVGEVEIASDPGPAEPESTEKPIALAEATPPAEIKPELVETLVAAAPEPLPEPAAELVEPGIATTATTEEEPAVVAAASSEKPLTEKPLEEKPPAEKPPEEKSPAVVAAGTSAQPTETKPTIVAVVLDLPAQGSLTYYLQLAAYSTEAMAKDTAARFSPTYPVLVLAPPAGTKPLYRVFVGPLNKAESGTLLTRFRHLGFPDVFARTAQN